MMRGLFAGVVSGLLCASTAVAAEEIWIPKGETQCSLGGWVKDKDPRGLNVRAAPSANAKVVGTLPADEEGEVQQDGHPWSYFRTGGFDIRGSANGWIRIENGYDYRVSDVPDEVPDRPAYKGSGWISGRYVGFVMQGETGRTRPNANSEAIVTLAEDLSGDAIENVVACAGKWVLLDFHQKYGRDDKGYLINLTPEQQAASRGRAWFHGVCDIMETTCDGVGDVRERYVLDAPCDVEGWVADTDPAGLNVRAQPSITAKVVGTLPALEQGKHAGKPYQRTGRFRVWEVRNGWLFITDGRDDRNGGVPADWPDRPAFSGSGWVAANHVGFDFPKSWSHTPAGKSIRKIVMDLPHDDWPNAVAEVDNVRACEGQLLQVDFHLVARRDANGQRVEFTEDEKFGLGLPQNDWFKVSAENNRPLAPQEPCDCADDFEGFSE
jgi:hypothetical protein